MGGPNCPRVAKDCNNSRLDGGETMPLGMASTCVGGSPDCCYRVMSAGAWRLKAQTVFAGLITAFTCQLRLSQIDSVEMVGGGSANSEPAQNFFA